MNTQLAAVVDSFEAAQRRVDALARDLTPERWRRPPAEGRWSAIACLAHLNLTAQAFLPLLDEGIAHARRLATAAPARYRRDLLGWLIWRGVKNPGRFKTRTPAAFVPGQDDPAQTLLAFAALQREQVARVRDCDGLPVQRVSMVSPFDARVRYNLYSGITILAAHQHRHLWQAEEAAAGR